STTAQCRRFEGFRFILLPTAFAKTLQELVWCLIGLRSVASPDGHTTVTTSHFRGAEMERALRYNSDAAFPFIDRLLNVLHLYAQFSMSTVDPVRVLDAVQPSSLRTTQDAELVSLYEMVEMF